MATIPEQLFASMNDPAAIHALIGKTEDRQLRDGTTVRGFRGQFTLPIRQTDDSDWIIFGGGVDDVIYPGSTIKIATLTQPSHEEVFPMPKRVLPQWSISVQLSADDTETRTVERTFAEKVRY
jgi:hypothetical protein